MLCRLLLTAARLALGMNVASPQRFGFMECEQESIPPFWVHGQGPAAMVGPKAGPGVRPAWAQLLQICFPKSKAAPQPSSPANGVLAELGDVAPLYLCPLGRARAGCAVRVTFVAVLSRCCRSLEARTWWQRRGTRGQLGHLTGYGWRARHCSSFRPKRGRETPHPLASEPKEGYGKGRAREDSAARAQALGRAFLLLPPLRYIFLVCFVVLILDLHWFLTPNGP